MSPRPWLAMTKTLFRRNAFGYRVAADPLAMYLRARPRALIDGLLPYLVTTILPDAPDRDRRFFLERLDRLSQEAGSSKELERQGGEWLSTLPSLREALRQALSRRSSSIFGQVLPHIRGTSILDVGCGDGEVSRLLARKFPVVDLADVIDYRNSAVRRRGLPFTSLTSEHDIRGIPPHDTTLLLTVLHHCEAPLKVLAETARKTRVRMVVIESVFGVRPSRSTLADSLTPAHRAATRAYAEASIATQRHVQTFFDWFYNRVVNRDVDVPLNFATPARWTQEFRRVGLRVLSRIDLGVDQLLVPEYHVLFVLEPSGQMVTGSIR